MLKSKILGIRSEPGWKKVIRQKGKKGLGGTSVPNRNTLTIDKEAMKRLLHSCVDSEIRLYEVVEAMIHREDFGQNGTSLLDYIKEMQKLTIKEESP